MSVQNFEYLSDVNCYNGKIICKMKMGQHCHNCMNICSNITTDMTAVADIFSTVIPIMYEILRQNNQFYVSSIFSAMTDVKSIESAMFKLYFAAEEIIKSLTKCNQLDIYKVVDSINNVSPKIFAKCLILLLNVKILAEFLLNVSSSELYVFNDLHRIQDIFCKKLIFFLLINVVRKYFCWLMIFEIGEFYIKCQECYKYRRKLDFCWFKKILLMIGADSKCIWIWVMSNITVCETLAILLFLLLYVQFGFPTISIVSDDRPLFTSDEFDKVSKWDIRYLYMSTQYFYLANNDEKMSTPAMFIELLLDLKAVIWVYELLPMQFGVITSRSLINKSQVCPQKRHKDICYPIICSLCRYLPLCDIETKISSKGKIKNFCELLSNSNYEHISDNMRHILPDKSNILNNRINEKKILFKTYSFFSEFYDNLNVINVFININFDSISMHDFDHLNTLIDSYTKNINNFNSINFDKIDISIDNVNKDSVNAIDEFLKINYLDKIFSDDKYFNDTFTDINDSKFSDFNNFDTIFSDVNYFDRIIPDIAKVLDNMDKDLNNVLFKDLENLFHSDDNFLHVNDSDTNNLNSLFFNDLDKLICDKDHENFDMSKKKL